MSRLTPAQAATKLLLQQRLNNLRFDITKLAYDRHILFDSIQNYCRLTTMRASELTARYHDGFTLIRRQADHTRYIVLWNAEITNHYRRRFTLAHEVGHIYLQHIDDGLLQEPEADMFAAQLLLPRILVEQVVWEWGETLAVSELCQVFSVSRQAAEVAIHRLQTPVCYTQDDDFLLQRFAPLLTKQNEPFVSV